MPSSLPEDYWKALQLLGKACRLYLLGTGHRIVIVGGAAVSFYTQGAVLSGDFDLVGDVGFERYLLSVGFVKEDRVGRLLRGYYHPEVPRLGFEFVSGALFEGLADRDKITAVALPNDEEVIFPAVEDLIADRLGQYAASNDRDCEMLFQARLLFQLATACDRDYLLRRIGQEGGNPAAIGLNHA